MTLAFIEAPTVLGAGIAPLCPGLFCKAARADSSSRPAALVEQAWAEETKCALRYGLSGSTSYMHMHMCIFVLFTPALIQMMWYMK